VQPLGDLVAVIEQTTGIDVAVLDVALDEHGMAMRDPARDAVFIGAASTEHPMRQRSTLAHELGHVIFADWADHNTGNWGAQTPEEIRCRAFARHLLVPIAGLREFLGDLTEILPTTLSAVVQRFLASPAISAFALAQAGYIDAAVRDTWAAKYETPQLATQFGWIDQYRALQADSRQQRTPQRLLARAIVGYAEGVVSSQQIATLRRISRAEAETELSAAGIVPIERPVAWSDADDLPDVMVDLAGLDDDPNAPDDRKDSATDRDSG
jgi:Zn-dependent peptidase ImmA (M78 family)